MFAHLLKDYHDNLGGQLTNLIKIIIWPIQHTSQPCKISSTPPCKSILLAKVNWLRIGRTWAPKCKHPSEGLILYKYITSMLPFQILLGYEKILDLWEI